MKIDRESVIDLLGAIVVIILIVLLVVSLPGCSTLADSQEQAFEIEVISEDCKKLNVKGGRGEVKRIETSEKGVNLKLRTQ